MARVGETTKVYASRKDPYGIYGLYDKLSGKVITTYNAVNDNSAKHIYRRSLDADTKDRIKLYRLATSDAYDPRATRASVEMIDDATGGDNDADGAMADNKGGDGDNTE